MAILLLLCILKNAPPPSEKKKILTQIGLYILKASSGEQDGAGIME
jgi:hypothetical protein